MERKLYASIVEKNPNTCAAAQKNVQYEYYSSDDVKKIKERVRFFDMIQNKFRDVDMVKTKIDDLVVKLDSDAKKAKFEEDKLGLPGNAGEPELEKRLINTMRDLKTDLENEIQASSFADGDLRTINQTVSTDPAYQANGFILTLDDAGSMWSTKYTETLKYNVDIKSNSNAPGKLLQSLILWIDANEFRETRITELAALYTHTNDVQRQQKEKDIRAAYPITYWTPTTTKASELENMILQRKGYLNDYNTDYTQLQLTGSVTQKMLEDGFTASGTNFPDVATSSQPISLIDAITTLQTAILQVQATNTDVDQTITQYRAVHGNGTNCADEAQLATLRLEPTAKNDINQLSIKRIKLVDDYRKYKPTVDADNAINMSVDMLRQFIDKRIALFDKYIKAFGQDGNSNFAKSVYGKTEIEINKQIQGREDVLAKARLYYTPKVLHDMEQFYKVNTFAFNIEVANKIKAFDDAKKLGIEEEQMKKLDAIKIEMLIAERKNVINSNKMDELWDNYDAILMANKKTVGVSGDASLIQACQERKQLIDAYNSAGSSKRAINDPGFVDAKTLTNADLKTKTQEMIATYNALKEKIKTLGDGLTPVGNIAITQADAAKDNPEVDMLKVVADGLEQDRLRILADFDPNVVKDVETALQTALDTISNAKLRNLLEQRKITSKRESDLKIFEQQIVNLRQEIPPQVYSQGDTEANIKLHIKNLKTIGSASLTERARLLKDQLTSYNPADPPQTLIQRAEKLVKETKMALDENEEQLRQLAAAAVQGAGLQEVTDKLLSDDASSIIAKPLEDAIIQEAAAALRSIDLSQIPTGKTFGHDYSPEDEMLWLDTASAELRQRIGDIIIQELTKTEDKAYDKQARLALKSKYGQGKLSVMGKLLEGGRNELMVELNRNTMFGVALKTPVIIGSWARFQFNYKDPDALAAMNELFPKVDFPELWDGVKTRLTGTLYIKLAVLQRASESDGDYEARKAVELRQVGDNKFFIEEVLKQLEETTVGQGVLGWGPGTPSTLRNPLLKNTKDLTLTTNIVGLGDLEFTVDGVREIGIKPSQGYDYSFLYAPSLTGFAKDLENLKLRHQDIVTKYVSAQNGQPASVTTDGANLTKLFFVFENFANIKITQATVKKMVEDFEIARNEKFYTPEQMDIAFARNFVRKFAPIPYIQPVDLAYIRPSTSKKDALKVGKRQYYLQCKNNEFALACSIFGHSWDINDLSKMRKNLYLFKDESVLIERNKKAVTTSNLGGSTSLMDTDDEDVGSKFRFIPNI